MVRSVLLGLLALSVTGCFTIRARSDYYADADFGGYARFAWISDMPFLAPPDYEIPISALNQRRIKEAVEAELAAKGYRKVEAPADADFVVSLTMGTRDVSAVVVYPPPYRGQWRWPGQVFGPDVGTEAYTEGLLSVDIFDQASKEPVWHGWATKRITDADLAKAEERITLAVEAILADFPPQA